MHEPLKDRHKAWVTGEEGAYYARCRCGWQTPFFEDPYECQDFATVHRDERTRLEEQDIESRYLALAVLNKDSRGWVE